MNHIIFDLELNMPFNKGLTPIDKLEKCPNEIIEIGAVKINEDFEFIDRYEKIIRPTFYKILSPIIKKKIGITYKELYSGSRFSMVIKEFIKWIGDEDYMLYAWGMGDLVDLRRNCRSHHVKVDWLAHFTDLQKEFSIKYEIDKGMNFSLMKALDFLGIQVEDKLHRAQVDADYTAQMFKRMYGPG